jgi:hypothetical protein
MSRLVKSSAMGLLLAQAVVGVALLMSSIPVRAGVLTVQNRATRPYLVPRPRAAGMVPVHGFKSTTTPTISPKTQSGNTSAHSQLNATKQMQETQMSFNLQYLQLQNAMQNENRQYTAVSNIMKTKHGTAKNAIGNIR